MGQVTGFGLGIWEMRWWSNPRNKSYATLLMIGSRRRKIYLRGAPRGPRPGPVGKTAVWGAVERGGRVTARVMADVSSFSILSNVRSRIMPRSTAFVRRIRKTG